MDVDEEYNRLYIRKSVNDEASNLVSFEIPSLHMILLYCEWFLSENALVEVMSTLRRGRCKKAMGNVFDLESFNNLLHDSALTETLRSVIGSELYDYACSAIGDGEVAIPLGLAPSFSLYSDGCTECLTPKYVRRFCLHCGILHADDRRVQYKSPVKRRKQSNAEKPTKHKNERHEWNDVHSKVQLAPSVDRMPVLHDSNVLLHGKLPNGTIHYQANTSAAVGTVYDPRTQSTSTVTAFSLQKLLALSKQNKAAPTPVTSEPVAEVEIVTIKKEVVVIDLITSDEDNDGDNDEDVGVPYSPPHSAVSSPVTMSSDRMVSVKPEPGVYPTQSGSAYTAVTQSSGSYTQGSLDDDLSQLDSEDGGSVHVKLEWPARRMDKYQMSAMRGVAALYKYGQSGVNPGDMLFLMRNLATNCTGLHRIAARCGFQKLCKQWVEAHASLHGHDSINDVLDVIEGTFTLAQLIRPTSASWAMYQETDIGAPGDTTEASAASSSAAAGAGGAGAKADSFVPPESAVWEDAQGNQESENDFASRIDYALSCTNLKFMIYSLTGDRRYYTLKSDPGEATVGTVDLLGSIGEDVAAPVAKRPRTAPSSSSSVPMSEFIVYPPDYVAPAPLPRKVTRGRADNGTESQNQNRVADRRCNPARASKLALWENLAEEFGSMDQFGQVTDEVALLFMECAAVVASSKVFIKENLKYTSLPDFIGIDLDKFALPAHLSKMKGKLGGGSTIRGTASSSTLSSSSNSSSTGKQSTSNRSAGRAGRGLSFSGENCIDSKFHGKQVYTGALCWPYITEEIGFDANLGVDKTLTNYQVKRSTLSKAVSNLARVRVYRGVEYFSSAEGTGTLDREAYKQQCYLATHVVYAFSDWGQHALRRALFAEEFAFFVTNFAAVLTVLRDAELVGEFMHCLRILQYTPEGDPDLVQLFEDGKDFLLRVEREFGCMGRWVAVRSARKEDIYTQYHATYCAVVGLADCHFAQDEAALLEPPIPRLLHHLRSEI